MFGKDKYIWKKAPRRHSSWGIYSFLMHNAYEEVDLDEEDYYNFNAYFRGKRNWKAYFKNYCAAKYAEKEYGVNLKLRKEKFAETDSWAYEEHAKAYHERKSWKRNSKKKHQYEK